MLEFSHPWAALLIPLPLLVWWLFPPYRQTVNAVRMPFFQALVNATGAEAQSGSMVMEKRAPQMIVMIAVWLLCVCALAKPQWVGEPITKTESARDVMLAIDLSGSMDKVDFPDESGTNIRRFDAVQNVVLEFIADRVDDRIGMIVFGDRAYLQLPFTRDLQTASELVKLMEVGMAGQQTALGDAIGLSIKSFESSEVDKRVLILLSDGSDTVSKMSPLNASEIAAQNNMEIFTIGMGDPQGEGDDKVDFEILQKVAENTAGEFFVAQDQLDLESIYQRIDDLTAAEGSVKSWRPRESLVHWPAGLAVSILMLAYLAMMVMPHRSRSVSGAENG